MKLFETIVEANHCAPAGARSAGVNPADFADVLPLVALTCIDARLNPLLPNAFGVPEEMFVWLRNAGNIITQPLSSTMRSLALACAVKNAREIAIVGHTDCQVAKTNAMALTDRFQKLGVTRQRLPENLQEFFGLFASERQNVLNAVEIVRQSPLIGPVIPVHGLLIDTQTGRLEWISNGYEQDSRGVSTTPDASIATPAFSTDWKPIGSYEPFVTTDLPAPRQEIGSQSTCNTTPSSGNTTATPEEQGAGATPSLMDQAKKWISEVRLADGQSLRDAATQVGRASVATAKELVELIDRNKSYRVIGSDLKEYGPIAGFKLVKWLMEDRITPDSPVRLEDGGEWQPLKNLIGGAVKKHVNIPPSLENVASRVGSALRNYKH